MNPRLVRNALGALAVAAALVTVASAQTAGGGQKPDKQDKDRKRDSQGTSATGVSSHASDDATTKDAPLRLRALAVDTNRAGGSATTTLDIVIERWSSDAERDHLRGVLQERGGGDALLSAVQKIKPRAGFIRTSSSIGWDIQFARETPLPDGARRIVFGTDRPMSFWESANRPRSADYQFMVAEIRIDKNGKGEGRLVPAAAVTYDEAARTIEVENYQSQPVNLTQVVVVGGSGGDHK